MVQQVSSPNNFKYIATVFLKTGLVTGAWFGLAGASLNALSERALLQCNRNEESLAECRLTVKTWLKSSHIELPAGAIQSVRSHSTPNQWNAKFVRWDTAIETSQGNFNFTSYGLAPENNWENFTNRTNKFIDAPEIRTLSVESEYSFWFNFLNRAVSGISLLCGLFIIPGLLLTLKYGNDLTAQAEALNQFGSKLGRVNPVSLSED